MKRALRKCLLDGGGAAMGRAAALHCHGVPDVEAKVGRLQPILPGVRKGPDLAKQTSAYNGAGCRPFRRGTPGIPKPAGQTFKRVMPLAMRNLAIAQQRDVERYRHVRGGG